MIGFTNNFSEGRNTDFTKAAVPNNQYTAAANVELVGDGKYYALQNIKGTTNVQQIIGSSTVEVLAVFANKYQILGASYDCLTIFTATPSSTFNIYCYNATSDSLYALYQESIDYSYLSEDRTVDAVCYPENGVDYLYFTDFLNEVRFLKCEIPSPYSANFLSSYDISLLRKGANGTISLSSIGSSGGTLLSGTYQFAYRMCDPVNKRFTRWSTLGSPIHVYSTTNSTSPVYSGIGLLTNKKITLSITPATEETTEYDYLQLAVIENVGVTVSNLAGVTTAEPTVASLLDIVEISGTSLTYEYTSNSKIGTIPISDIVVPLAPIKNVKTITVKENRLFLGNINYNELEFDNGTPSVTSGSFVTQTSVDKDAYSSDDFASRYIGYWRDEVYRFGIVYYDQDGNASPVQPLDLDGIITGNQITSGLPDVKFPTRTNNAYTVFNTSNEIRALGLQLNGITNHPTWARAFEIVRVKRIKNILFQTPVVPMMSVDGVGALSRYPTSYFVSTNSADGTTLLEATDAQPQTSSTILIPKNFFWPELRAIRQNGAYSGSGLTFKADREVKLVRNSSYSYIAIFPSPSMYGDTPFTYTGSEKMDVIDYALLRYTTGSFATPTYDYGDFIKTSIVGNFYALSNNQYYYDASHAKLPLTSLQNISITDYEFFDNFGQPASVGGNSVLDYEALQTKGVGFWQYKPNANKMGVCQLNTELSEGALTFAAGTLNAVSNNNYIIGSSGPRYEPTNTLTNAYITEYASATANSSYISAIPIANVKLGLGDARYGDINTFHEYISTGAKYTFSTSEIATLEAGGSVSKNITVWGGDCFVGPQLFKVSDSTYSITNQTKNNTPPTVDSKSTGSKKWGACYEYITDASDPVMCIPVAVENCGQYVQVVLESEYNGEVRDNDVIGVETSTNGMPIYINRTEASIRTPLTYRYNLNLSKQNDRRVFVPKPTYSFEQNEFGARIAYSDIKIYNSDQAGFDIFRVGNFYDLEENKRSITKLAVAGDAMYAIQQQGVTYVPTGERQIEATDAGQLSVRSGDVIGRPLVVDATRGSQHLRGIVETGQVIYIPDNINKNVYVLSGQELKPITQNNETEFRTFFANYLLDERKLLGIFDPIRREYWLADYDNNRCEVFNETKGWIGTYDFTGLMGGVWTNQALYLLGRPSSSLDVYTMYTGDVNQLFGVSVTPSVTFVVNPDGTSYKTFDNFQIAASSALSTLDFTTEGTTPQTVTGTSVDITPREGTYRGPVPRATSEARLKGLQLVVTAKWKAVQSAFTDFKTRYRHSLRRPF
jgi:hypothetical protein